MTLTRCSKGHFYNSEKYASCPHCENGSVPGETVSISKTASEDGRTEELGVTAAIPVKPVMPNILSDAEKTIGIYQKDLEIAPVVGWLVCIEGRSVGQDYRLKSGRNFIGRSKDMDVQLTDESVSRDRHAIVVFDPVSCKFVVQPGESHELVYLNGNMVLLPTELKAHDVLGLGACKLMLSTFCDEQFDWLSKK